MKPTHIDQWRALVSSSPPSSPLSMAAQSFLPEHSNTIPDEKLHSVDKPMPAGAFKLNADKIWKVAQFYLLM